MNIINLITYGSQELHLTQTEVEINRYIKYHLRSFEKITISKISNDCYCTPTSVTRYCKKLGYNGFKELKSRILLHNDRTKKDSYLSSLDQILLQLNELNLKPIIDLLLKNKEKRILIVGMGTSFVAATYLSKRLNTNGFDSDTYTFYELIRDKIERYDFIILFSKSGLSPTSIIAEEAMFSKRTIIAFTEKDSYLSTIVKNSVCYPKYRSNSKKDNRDSQVIPIVIIEQIINKLTEEEK